MFRSFFEGSFSYAKTKGTKISFRPFRKFLFFSLFKPFFDLFGFFSSLFIRGRSNHFTTTLNDLYVPVWLNAYIVQVPLPIAFIFPDADTVATFGFELS